MKLASTVTVVLFTFLASGFFAAVFAAAATDGGVAEETAAVFDPEGAGVPVRLCSVLTVRSLPCVSISTPGNSANLVSRATGSLDLTSL